MDRREFIVAAAAAALVPAAARAQGALPLLARLHSTRPDDPVNATFSAAIHVGLAELGWVPGVNYIEETRYSSNDRVLMRSLGQELIALGPTAILTSTTPPTEEMARLTQTIPIVFHNVSDPIGSGLVRTFAQPGGNVTGFAAAEQSLGGKWVQQILLIAPEIRRIGLLFNPITAPAGGNFYRGPFETAAAAARIETVMLPVTSIEEAEIAIAAFAAVPGSGLVVASDSFTFGNRVGLVEQVARTPLPALYPYRDFVLAGGLAAYAIDAFDLARRSGVYVGRVLNGESPAVLPVQFPTAYDLILNLATARAQSFTFPAAALALASEVLE